MPRARAKCTPPAGVGVRGPVPKRVRCQRGVARRTVGVAVTGGAARQPLSAAQPASGIDRRCSRGKVTDIIECVPLPVDVVAMHLCIERGLEPPQSSLPFLATEIERASFEPPAAAPSFRRAERDPARAAGARGTSPPPRWELSWSRSTSMRVARATKTT